MTERHTPVDAISKTQASGILGVSVMTVSRMTRDGRLRTGHLYAHSQLSRADVETLALENYHWRRHRHDPKSYWVTTLGAAEILGVNRQRVRQLCEAGRIPFEVHREGIRLHRRQQIDVIANARLSRKLQA